MEVRSIKDAVSWRFDRLMKEKGLNPYSLANLAGVPQSTVYSLLDESRRHADIVTIKKLCDGLNITITAFFTDDIFETLDQEIM